MNHSDNTTPHLSAEYDLQILNTIPHYELFHASAINIVKVMDNEPELWLDTGAGTGTMVRKCLDIFPNTLFFVADPSDEMLAVAKNKLAGYGEDRVRFLDVAKTQEVLLDAGLHPDVITAIQSHHYLLPEERKAATMVCYELLSEDGVFITFENVKPFTAKGIAVAKQSWSNYQLSKGKSEEQVKKHIDRFDAEYFPITVEEHLELYRECGFRVVELLWYSYMQAGFYCVK